MQPIYALILLVIFGAGDAIQPFSFDVGKRYHNRAACNAVLKKRIRQARRHDKHRRIGGACIVIKPPHQVD